jgi:hypothetical protein
MHVRDRQAIAELIEHLIHDIPAFSCDDALTMDAGYARSMVKRQRRATIL